MARLSWYMAALAQKKIEDRDMIMGIYIPRVSIDSLVGGWWLVVEGKMWECVNHRNQ